MSDRYENSCHLTKKSLERQKDHSSRETYLDDKVDLKKKKTQEELLSRVTSEMIFKCLSNLKYNEGLTIKHICQHLWKMYNKKQWWTLLDQERATSTKVVKVSEIQSRTFESQGVKWISLFVT